MIEMNKTFKDSKLFNIFIIIFILSLDNLCERRNETNVTGYSLNIDINTAWMVELVTSALVLEATLDEMLIFHTFLVLALAICERF